MSRASRPKGSMKEVVIWYGPSLGDRKSLEVREWEELSGQPEIQMTRMKDGCEHAAQGYRDG